MLEPLVRLLNTPAQVVPATKSAAGTVICWQIGGQHPDVPIGRDVANKAHLWRSARELEIGKKLNGADALGDLREEKIKG